MSSSSSAARPRCTGADAPALHPRAQQREPSSTATARALTRMLSRLHAARGCTRKPPPLSSGRQSIDEGYVQKPGRDHHPRAAGKLGTEEVQGPGRLQREAGVLCAGPYRPAEGGNGEPFRLGSRERTWSALCLGITLLCTVILF